MLTKLIKRDIIRDYKPMLILTGVIIFTALLFKLYHIIFMSNPTADQLYFSANIIRVCFYIISYVVILISLSIPSELFKKTMMQNEGYLTHTLPVKASELLLSKMLTSYIWSIFVIGVFLISDYILNGDTALLHALFTPSFLDGLKVYAGIPSDNYMPTFIGLILIFMPFISNSFIFFVHSTQFVISKFRWAIIIVCVITLYILFFYFNFSYLGSINTELSLEQHVMETEKLMYASFVWIPLLASAVLYYLSYVIFTKKLNLV